MNKIRCIFIEKTPVFPLKKDLEYQLLKLPKLNGSVWQIQDENNTYTVDKSVFVPVIEGHWSINDSDTHDQDDADSTYLVLLPSGDKIIFKTLLEAKEFIQGNEVR